ncbi:MAG: hypothetical protein IT294_02945 [Deltaproteobacteria bacterium]|nr:hypothetical protein [Deltaproteobacteria bacterium]
MANPTGQEMREAVAVVAERLGYGKLYDRLVRLNAFVSRRRPPTPAILADRLYNLSGGLRRNVPATIAFHTVWAEAVGRAIGEDLDKTLEGIAERINATLTPDEHAIQPDKHADLAAALDEYERALVGVVGPVAARLDMIMKAVPAVADTVRTRPLPAAAATGAPAPS